MNKLLSISLLLSLAGCSYESAPTPVAYAPIVPGPPEVGAAEGTLELPVGTPLAGYTFRCGCLSGYGKVDDRDSAYQEAFIESVGVQTTPTIKVVWIDNGDDNLVIARTDNIYSFDGIVAELQARLEDATGEDLAGKVVHTTNHSHHSWGAFTQQKAFYLGSDKYNEEIFQRFLAQLTEVALEAYDNRQPAKIGMGWAKDWDPNNKVYSDRRPENDELKVWDDVPPGMGKDPHLAVMRFDSLDDDPIALIFNFGMHGIVLDDKNNLVSADASSGIEQAVQERFDQPVVTIFTQGSAGDASPRGSDEEYARLETLGVYAVDPIYDLWSSISTSADPIRLETASRAFSETLDDIHVTRNGSVDWRYSGYQGPDFRPDEIVYNDDGSLASPIDEFNTTYGSAFCGTGDLDFPIGGLTSTVFPYTNCLEVELMSRLILAFFHLTEEEMVLPMPETVRALTTVSRLGPIPTLYDDGSSDVADLLVGFFPGEPTAMYGEQWRRRAQDELGYKMPLSVGYSQDHEGYLLLAEDWLVGGYEPDITFWGPLQAEYLMEGMLTTADEILGSDVHDDPDPYQRYQPTTYWDEPLPTAAPDLTPDAGTMLVDPPDYYYLPREIEVDLSVPAEVPRVQGMVQLGWIGGDPGVDFPRVALERKDGGNWVEVTSHSGRPITVHFPDIVLTHTPDPLYPADAKQTHYWWAGWQAVSHIVDRTGLPLGSYRLHVSGQRYVGGAQTWPWPSEPYEVVGDSFEIVPAALSVTVDVAGGGLWVWMPAPAKGFRLIDIDGNSRGDNPVRGELTIEVTDADGTTSSQLVAEAPAAGRSWVSLDLTAALSVRVTDAFGNTGVGVP